MKSIHYIDRKTGNLQKETVPGEKWLQWLYHSPAGRIALWAIVKRRFLSRWYGRKMDTPASKAKIADFINTLKIDMNEVARPVSEFSSFNDFFIRKLKPGTRPIDKDPAIITSPADGKVLAFDKIDRLDTFFAKGQKFSLDKFLQNPSLSAGYAGGSLLIIRLAPADYHRFHFPADGHISEPIRIAGHYFSVSPYAVKNRLRIYWENERVYSILRTERAGNILLGEVGAALVGAIVQNYAAQTTVKKGQEKGWFKFGGSTIILLFEKGKVRADRDLIENTRKGFETAVTVGERLASVT